MRPPELAFPGLGHGAGQGAGKAATFEPLGNFGAALDSGLISTANPSTMAGWSQSIPRPTI